ncbi:hypothetical protein MXB_3839 [Myxobolus squamalis]|nr:hypothetical protein MXB_3839 [Myxobolus squamalis]
MKDKIDEEKDKISSEDLIFMPQYYKRVEGQTKPPPNNTRKFKYGLENCSFESLLKTTNLQEGNLIRHVLRIDEICKELEKAAVHIGNLELQTCAKTCRQLIKRDIINVSSLYLTEQI